MLLRPLLAADPLTADLCYLALVFFGNLLAVNAGKVGANPLEAAAAATVYLKAAVT